MEILDNLPKLMPKAKVRLGFKCPFCLAIFANGPSLIDHLRVHNLVTKPESNSDKTRLKDLSIPPCYVRLTRCDNSISSQRPGVSEAVGQKNIEKENSKNYSEMRSKHGKKLHACSECPKTFLNLSRFQRHFRSHTGEKPFICPHCPSRFANSASLKRHVTTVHMKEKRFKCVHCDRSFSLPYYLKLHIRIHTGQKPYICTHCDRRFSQRVNLKRHVITHTGERPHHCKLCGYKSAHKSTLKRHYTGFHKLVNWTP